MTKQIDALRKALALLETLSVHASMSDEHRNEVSIVRLVLRDAITEGNRRASDDLLAALKRLVSILSPEIHGSDGSALEQARAAIARHEHE